MQRDFRAAAEADLAKRPASSKSSRAMASSQSFIAVSKTAARVVFSEWAAARWPRRTSAFMPAASIS